MNDNECEPHDRPRRITPLARILGPGLITGAANDDPSSIATFSQSGAQFGYNQLWVVLFLYPLLTAVQELSARIGAVTGKGVAAIMRERYNKKVLFPAILLVGVANTINLGADIGAIAVATHLLLPIPVLVLTVCFSILILILQIFISYKRYSRILKLLALSLLAYPVTLFIVTSSWEKLLYATFLPHFELNFGFLFMVMASIGTTISPYMFIWQASEEVEEEIVNGRMGHQGPCVSWGFIRDIRIDTAVGMFVSQLTFWAITAVAASEFHDRGITDIKTAAQAAQALEPLVQSFPHAGLIAKTIFAIGIIGLGLLAVPILAGSASYAMSEAFKCRVGLNLKFHEAKCFYSVIIGATIIGMVIAFTRINPFKALIFSSVVNCICSVPLLYLLARIGRDPTIMGRYRSGWLSNGVVWITFVAMAAATVSMFVSILL